MRRKSPQTAPVHTFMHHVKTMDNAIKYLMTWNRDLQLALDTAVEEKERAERAHKKSIGDLRRHALALEGQKKECANSLKSKISELDRLRATKTSDVQTKKMAELQKKNTALQRSLTDYQKKNVALDGRMHTLEKENSDLLRAKDALVGKIKSLQTEIDAAKLNIERMTKRLTNQRLHMATLEVATGCAHSVLQAVTPKMCKGVPIQLAARSPSPPTVRSPDEIEDGVVR